MKITPAHIILPIIAILVGMAIIYAGLWGGWGIVWAAGGGFFIVLGLGATLLTLAWALPDPAGAFLRQPMISILILLIVLSMLYLTVSLGILNQIR
jgi:hypothetical protein